MDPKTNWSIHTPHWHPDERTPVVDGKYYDKKTGELLVAADDSGYLGPPAVDIIISNLNYDTGLYVSRWARQFPVEQLLWQIMKVVKANELQIASVNATLYSINIMLTAEATKEQMNGLSDRMANGIWEPEVFMKTVILYIS